MYLMYFYVLCFKILARKLLKKMECTQTIVNKVCMYAFEYPPPRPSRDVTSPFALP